MKIETTFKTSTRENLRSLSRVNRHQPSQTWTDFPRNCSLEMSLAEVPDVRASEVARGKALIADPNYPSKAQMKSVARVLAASGLGR